MERAEEITALLRKYLLQHSWPITGHFSNTEYINVTFIKYKRSTTYKSNTVIRIHVPNTSEGQNYDASSRLTNATGGMK
jgi:hypothetical protein